MTNKSEIVKHYKSKLPTELQKTYEQISHERMNISYQGYLLGIIISGFIIYYNLTLKGTKLTNISLVCTVIATCFITNYFYYILHPKTDWMLNHINNQKDIQTWLVMYKEMQYNYHMGLVLGIISVGILAFAFRC